MKGINQKFNILSAIGIIAVVGFHCSFSFIDWFPPSSFHMPLFMFISGYFFKNYETSLFFKKKVFHLLVPFLLWNAFYGFLITFLCKYDFTHMEHAEISLLSLFWYPFTYYSYPFVFNGPAWFVGTLFLVQILYFGLYNLTRGKYSVIFIVSVFLYLLGLKMAFHGFSESFCGAGVTFERVFFCLIFYYLGNLYKAFLERKDSFSFGKVMALFLFNATIIGFITPDIRSLVVSMDFSYRNYWLPFALACSGIGLCLQIADILKNRIKESEFLSYVGQHTFSIMMHHQFFFWLLNTMLWYLKKMDVLTLNTFDYEVYMNYIYFRITAHPPFDRLIYLIAGICGPLICCWIYESCIQKKLKAYRCYFRRHFIRF